ncbi:pyridine nucleotide-disulfide oxidoreductase/dicluster-binding protein [Telmatospirillum sp.]|uniref:pyridine nucleotide-disulfide oxidoreductase/dicluster-binding protein n=1 Tax=Telmatospirillum sp. TaxID=2079197 RepID=UPI0028503AE1|nr:pyridine nucleotide-disulfide oxidoreductase/dicluster-binding protein [Telmatospirillum sp.]MDR3439966.1 heterodisulfide reductase-related iron-sulfur binding cluster [Telmatospirillum sp.]
MERQRVQELEAQCIEEQPPACTAGCPIHLDVRGMMDHLRKGDFASGFGIVARFLPFPSIVSRICDHPCELVCKRAEAGEPLRINDAERACVDHGFKASALPRPQRAQRKRRIAIVGAGLSGLTAAVDLGMKGYETVVFEAKPEVLGRIRDWKRPPLPASLIETDLEVLKTVGIVVRANTSVGDDEVTIASLVDDFDAIYLGLGSRPVLDHSIDLQLDESGRAVIDPLTFATSHPKVFAGGCHRYGPAVYSPIMSLHDGRYAAMSIDRMFQGASLSANRETQGPYQTRLFTKTSVYTALPAIVPAEMAQGYSAAEAVEEASRCFPCHCLECVKVCEYLAHYGSYPKRYIREIYNNDCIVMGAHKTNRMANTCSLCGLCEAVCPEHLPMAGFCQEARQSMVQKGKMQSSFHDFPLRDMAFSNSDAFAMARHQPGSTASAFLFFPGCQLAASSPDHVAAAYQYLGERLSGGVGLMLGCCGAPAHWGGREDLFQSALGTISAQWNDMGRPAIITACSSCYRVFKDNLPDLPVSSIWSVLDEIGLPPVTLGRNLQPLAIHDPCTTRQEEAVQKSVRNLLNHLGVSPIELNEPGLTTCCGFGGLMSFANPDVADKTVDRRAKDSDADYVTYCAMCRDNFARRGKPAMHILDLVFGKTENPAAREDPGFSRRQENRARLKNMLLREVWHEPMIDEQDLPELNVSPKVHALAEKRLILLSEVRDVIAHAETTSEKIRDSKSGHFIAAFRPHAVTYWVEYSLEGEGFAVHNVYSHRMKVGTDQPS